MIGRADWLNHEFGLSAGGLFTDHHLIVIKNEKDGDPKKSRSVADWHVRIDRSEIMKKPVKMENDSLA